MPSSPSFFRRNSLWFPLFLLFSTLAACGAGPTSGTAGEKAPGAVLPPIASGPGIPAPWLPLTQRLQADGVSPDLVKAYFTDLSAYSPDPMGTKVRELYRIAFAAKAPVKPVDPNAPPPPPPSRIFRNVVTAKNLERCTTFLDAYKTAFDGMEKHYGVPRNIVVSLMLLETSLGRNLGKQNAFWSLASMAAAVTPDLVAPAVADLDLTDRREWLQAKLTDKSDWAYKELKALITHCSAQNIDPKTMPGSVYGAIGMCQFMPSNLVPYGADGNGDGVVNLFMEPDAIASVGKYLSANGWKGSPTVAQQRKNIKRYNNHTMYANTILAMAETIRTGVLQTGPPDAPPVKKIGKKVAGKKAGKAAATKATPKAKKQPSRRTSKASAPA